MLKAAWLWSGEESREGDAGTAQSRACLSRECEAPAERALIRERVFEPSDRRALGAVRGLDPGRPESRLARQEHRTPGRIKAGSDGVNAPRNRPRRSPRTIADNGTGRRAAMAIMIPDSCPSRA